MIEKINKNMILNSEEFKGERIVATEKFQL